MGGTLELPRMFSNHMVLQRDRAVPIWGSAEPGQNVSVSFAGKNKTAQADAAGKWLLRLDPMPVNEVSGELQVNAGASKVTYSDVVVGDVWVCGGQSNMERQLGLRGVQQPIVNWEAEAAQANFPLIRHFGVAQKIAEEPVTNVTGEWKVCSPETVTNFTAVGYFFARELHTNLHIPIGLLHSTIGGTNADSWMEKKAVEQDPTLQPLLAAEAKTEQDFPALLAKYQADEPALLTAYEAALQVAQTNGGKPPNKPSPPRDPKLGNHRAGVLYNGMIAPLQPYAIRGVIWYQGESDCGNPKLYRTLFPALIADWRQTWGQGDFPFLFVQLAPYHGNNPELREAQLMTSQSVPNTAMVVTTDCGDAEDIHPPNKKPIGERLALAARALAYGEKIEYSGPIFRDAKIDDGKAIVSFTHIAGGLVAKDGELKGFALIGADKKIVPAKAEIEGDHILVSAPEVPQPVAVRYGWANVPDVNLYNSDGLPASPFRSDSNQ